MILANHRTIGRHDVDVQVVDFGKLRGFRIRGSGHPRQFFIHPKIVLKRDGRQGLIFVGDFHAFLGFDRLV